MERTWMGGEKRKNSRVVPILSDEEVVMLHLRSTQGLAKILDISTGGALAFLVDTDLKVSEGAACQASFYHKGRVLQVDARISRKEGRMIGLEFLKLTPRLASQIKAKLSDLESSFTKSRS